MKKIIVFIALSFIVGFNLYADPAAPVALSGEIIFSCNEKSPNQIFIIALSHRDDLTKANGKGTVKAQVEIYRIGEWLIQKEGLELLLPEGFSKEVSDEKKELTKFAAPENGARVLFDAKTLEEELGKEDVYINAEMLLMANYGIKSGQVEDLNLYNAVREKISLLKKYGDNDIELLFIKADIDYFQERRTAAMLQKIPEIVEDEYKAGNIQSEKAILTIGMSHIPAIVKYLKQRKIEISSPAFSPYDDYSSEVELLEKDFGVTIIIPKTLTKLQIDGQ